MLATAIPRSKPRSPEVIRLLLALGPTHAQRPKLQWPATPNPSRTGNARASGHDAMLPQPRQRSKGLLQHQCPKNLRDGPATCSRPTGRQNRSLLESSGGRPLFFFGKAFSYHSPGTGVSDSVRGRGKSQIIQLVEIQCVVPPVPGERANHT